MAGIIIIDVQFTVWETENNTSQIKSYRNANYMYYKYKDYLLVIPSVEIGYSTYSIHMNSDLKQ